MELLLYLLNADVDIVFATYVELHGYGRIRSPAPVQCGVSRNCEMQQICRRGCCTGSEIMQLIHSFCQSHPDRFIPSPWSGISRSLGSCHQLSSPPQFLETKCDKSVD